MLPPLDIAATGFSLDNARVCALASRLAYAAATITDEPTDTQVNLTCDLNGNIIIAFRGTTNLRDWLTDFRAWRTAIQGCEIHSGFLCAFRNVLDPIRASLAKIIGVKNIFLTGHSLGAALAELCAAEFALDGLTVHSVYTFGQPRIGNATFCRRYNASPLATRTFRLVHEEDIVPRVPFLIFGYRHTGQLVLLDSFGRRNFNPSVWQLLLSDIWGELRAYRENSLLAALEPFNDHNLDRYLTALES